MIKSFIERLRKHKILSAIITLAGGSALGQIIGLISTPIASRIYDVSAYGDYALIASTASIICTISQAGLASAIMMPDEDSEARSIFQVTFILQMIVVFMFTAVVLALSNVFKLFPIGLQYQWSVVALCVYVILTNLYSLLQIYMNRQKLYRALFWNSIIGAFGTLFITIPLGFLGVGAWGFIAAAIASMTICCLQMLHHAKPFCKINIQTVKTVFKKYRDYVTFQLPANLIDSFSMQLPTQLFGRYFDSTRLGSYSMSEKIAGIPLKFIAAPVNAVYFQTAAEYQRSGKDLAEFTFKLITKIMLIAAIPLVLLYGFGEEIFSFVLGDQWSEAGKIAAILGFNYVFVVCSTCISYCRVTLGKQKLNFLISIFHLIVIALSIYLGLAIENELITVIIAFAIGNCFYHIVDMEINFVLMRKYYGKYLAFTGAYMAVLSAIGFGIRFWLI